jgi:hypothetical protein
MDCHDSQLNLYPPLHRSQDYVYSDDQDIDLLVVLRVAADSAEVEDWRAIRRLLMDKCPQPPYVNIAK